MATEAWSRYLKGFSKAGEPWPRLPLAEPPKLNWCQQLMQAHSAGFPLLEALKQALPQHRLPQVAGISSSAIYKRAVLRGEPISTDSLATAGALPRWEHPKR